MNIWELSITSAICPLNLLPFLPLLSASHHSKIPFSTGLKSGSANLVAVMMGMPLRILKLHST